MNWQRLLRRTTSMAALDFQATNLSAWLIPLTYAAVAVVGGFTVPRIAHGILPGLNTTISVNAAIGIYSAIASGMIALTGIVFSLTFLMVQFSATAYSPRLVLWIGRDPVVSHATGVFTATFLYALSALAWVDRYGSNRVPLSGMLVVSLLLIVSIIMFVGLIQRIGKLQVTQMLTFTSDQGREVIEKLYPPLDTPPSPALVESLDIPCTQSLFHHGHPSKVQMVGIEALVGIASRAGCVVEMVAAVGDAVLDSTPILRVFGCSSQLPEDDLRRAIRLGKERTFEQDPKYAIRLLVDIAIRALSPAVNDPTTAVQALDHIEDLLIRLGRRRLEIGAFRDVQGRLRLLVAFPAWEDFLILALDEIRFYGATSIQVMRRMMALVGELLSIVPEERRPALLYWQERLESTVAGAFRDKEDILDASREDRQGLGSSRRDPNSI
ncbi:MAG TPA: DUF2254 domain-containing protein [Terriglobales bacterium]|nr:DUF2254 domain-containing protein [Terriglobales bacterium]